MAKIIFAFLAVLQLACAATLQFVSPPPDRSVTLYSAPSTYNQVPGKPAMNTIIIKSDPARTNNSKLSNTTSITKWRRNLFVSSSDKEYNNYDNKGTERNLPQYSIDCTDEKSCSETISVDSTPPPTFKPYSQEELEKFLKDYAATHGNLPGSDDKPDEDEDVAKNKLANLYMDEEAVNVVESTSTPSDAGDKSKSAHWQLIKSQSHNHPYDDQKGWVTLEPIPWSSSQIQKWEPNPHKKPEIPPWDSPPDNQHHHHSSHWNSRPQNDWTTEKPWHKPTYVYRPSYSPPHNSDQWHHESKPQHWSSRPPPPPPQWTDHSDIITDGRPGYFPSERPASHRPWYDNEYGSSRPPQYEYHDEDERHPPGYPTDGDGKWVLLSSTKGYSIPHRHRGYQRAMTFDGKSPESVSSHRTVRLTVLPALDNSTNMTTSHGGLLEVESTFQSVDEAQREHAAKMMKLEKIEAVNGSATVAKSAPLVSHSRSGEVKIFTSAPSGEKTKQAVLAAVGAGMIPATMAMLLPMVLGRKKRSVYSPDMKYFMYKAKKPVRIGKKKFMNKMHYR